MDDERETIEFTQQCLEYLNDMLRDIEALSDDVYILNGKHLAALNVQKAEPLDSDETGIDLGRRFFAPRLSLQQARQKTCDFLNDHQDYIGNEGWRPRWRRGSWPGAIVFSFHHDSFGRITQLHLDSRSMPLTMRQSPLLDFRSDGSATDAYHMIRWMGNRPIGDTEFGAAIGEDKGLGFRDGRGANNGKLPVEVE